MARETNEMCGKKQSDFEEVVLRCGHDTVGESPVKFMDGDQLINFVLRNV